MTSGTHAQRGVLVLGATLIALLSAGWFMVSWRVVHTPAGDAFGEALGVVFGLLILVSAVGASRRARSDDDGTGRPPSP